MIVKPFSGRIMDTIEADQMRADVAKERAITEYNIMMGILEDPAEDEEETEAE